VKSAAKGSRRDGSSKGHIIRANMTIDEKTRARRGAALLLLFGTCVIGIVGSYAQRGAIPARRPGRERGGATLLPNGWRIAPAGRHVQIGDLPLNMVASPDGRYIVITNNGWAEPTLTVFDTKTEQVISRIPVEHAWLGLAWHPDSSRIFSAGAAENTIHEFKWSNGALKDAGAIAIGLPERRAGGELQNAGFIGGLAMAQDGRRLYAVHVFGQAVSAIDLETRREVSRAALDAEPYTCLLSKDGKTLYVSLWGGSKVLIFEAATLAPLGEVSVGGHPNSMLLSEDGGRLFVACANTNAVWVIDLATRVATEQISVALYPDSPVGTTPNSLTLSPDGATMLVANADNNNVAMVDVRKPGASRVAGWIPVGWYPTSVLYSADGSRVFVLDGKGLSSDRNLRGPQPGGARMDGQYTGAMLQGALSIIATPGPPALAAMTRRVYELSPYTAARRMAPADAPFANPVPRRVGLSSPIKHVFYVIRENRTYDQVLGDMPTGNGDPSITLFGQEVTPNAHAIARDFTLFDNFYVDAEVSYDGHAFSMAAYATDVVEKLWPTNYGSRGTPYLSEGGYKMRGEYGNFSAPPLGYLWDFAKRAGVTVRSYGEFAAWAKRGGLVRATVPGLEGLVHPSYPPFDLDVPDKERADIWLEEFRTFERDGNLPRLSIIRLGNDHTSGTSPGAPTPRAMVADNDVALGRIVEAVSHSRYWKDSAIFVLEDDAQNGPDHIDAHRSVLLCISPFSRRRTVDSTLYTTSGVLRTIELILGLPPMSQYDAAATPMYNAFQATPDAAPFTHLPARVPLDERNDWSSPGASASLRMNLREADLAPELALNEILWQSVHGAGAVMPPPRRSGFIRPIDDQDDDEAEEPRDDDTIESRAEKR
jgi:DNA-binding beta-propeller fold protein YncE